MQSNFTDVAVIGGGISGLSLAAALQKKGIRAKVFEASSEAGGMVRTVQNGLYRFDTGPNSLLADENVLQFLADVGAGELLLKPVAVSKNRYILLNGAPRLLPASPLALLKSDFFSWYTKRRILTEFFRRREQINDESLANFVRRRFSDEAVEKVLKPFVAGIYAGDPEELLASESFPQLVAYEQKYGSVLRGMIKSGGGGRKQSFSFRGGMQTLPKLLAEKVNIAYGMSLKSIEKTGRQLDLIFDNQTRIKADFLVLALPAYRVAEIIEKLYPQAAAALRHVYYPPVCVVHTVFEKNKIGLLPEGFGLLHPPAEKTFTAGSIWSSSIFPDCCPEEQVLFTNFVGGAMFAAHAELPRERIIANVTAELQRIYHISDAPVTVHFTRWERAIPQYDRRIISAKKAASCLQKENIFCHSNWVHGISLADCIRASMALAEKLSN